MNKKIITQIIACILFAFILIVSLITVFSSIKAKNLAFLNYRFYAMKAEEQPEIAKKGDLVIAKRLKYGEAEVGNKIVYGNGEVYYCDEIVETKKTDKISKIIISEKNGIKYQFSEDDVSGKVVKVIPKIGSLITVLRSKLGIILTSIVIICIFVLLRMALLKTKEA